MLPHGSEVFAHSSAAGAFLGKHLDVDSEVSTASGDDRESDSDSGEDGEPSPRSLLSNLRMERKYRENKGSGFFRCSKVIAGFTGWGIVLSLSLE